MAENSDVELEIALQTLKRERALTIEKLRSGAGNWWLLHEVCKKIATPEKELGKTNSGPKPRFDIQWLLQGQHARKGVKQRPVDA